MLILGIKVGLGLQKAGKPAWVVAKSAHTGPWPPPRRVRNIMSAIMLRRSGMQPRCPARVSTARPRPCCNRCSRATFVVVCSDRKVHLRSCMGTCFNHLTYLNWPFTLLPSSGHRSRAGRSCLATGISHRYTEKGDRRLDIARNRYRFSPPGWWSGTPWCRMYRSLWIYLTI